MPETPRTSKVVGSYTWIDGTNFNGFAVIGFVLPDDGVDDWATIHKGGTSETLPTRLPVWAIIPIVDGTPNESLGLFYNADLVPQESKYVWYAYDWSLKQIAGASTKFSVTAAETTLPTLTLTTPIAGSTVPTPDT